MITMTHIVFEEFDTRDGRALKGVMPVSEANGYILVRDTSRGIYPDRTRVPRNLESEPFFVSFYRDGDDEAVCSVCLNGRKGLNDWYLANVGYRPDEDNPAGLYEIQELLANTAEMMFYHLVPRNYQLAQGAKAMNHPQAAEAKEATLKTYLTMRFADGQKKDGTGTYKNVMNLFSQGGKDSRGLPIVSNHGDKTVGWVNATAATLDLRHTDEEGNVIKDGDKPSQPFLSINLERFTKGNADPKALEAGQGSVSGPGAADLVAAFKDVIAKKPEKKAAAAPSM